MCYSQILFQIQNKHAASEINEEGYSEHPVYSNGLWKTFSTYFLLKNELSSDKYKCS